MNIDAPKNTINSDTVKSISCETFDDFIVDYIDDNLSDEEKRIFLRHLNECEPCRKYLENYQRNIALSQTAFVSEEDTSQKEMPEELVSAILATRTSVK